MNTVPRSVPPWSAALPSPRLISRRLPSWPAIGAGPWIRTAMTCGRSSPGQRRWAWRSWPPPGPNSSSTYATWRRPAWRRPPSTGGLDRLRYYRFAHVDGVVAANPRSPLQAHGPTGHREVRPAARSPPSRFATLVCSDPHRTRRPPQGHPGAPRPFLDHGDDGRVRPPVPLPRPGPYRTAGRGVPRSAGRYRRYCPNLRRARAGSPQRWAPTREGCERGCAGCTALGLTASRRRRTGCASGGGRHQEKQSCKIDRIRSGLQWLLAVDTVK